MYSASQRARALILAVSGVIASLLCSVNPMPAIASVVVTQTEERSSWSLWLLSTHIQQISAHRQIMDNHDIIVVPVFTDEAMAEADIVYLSPSYDELNLTNAEIDALIRFVEAGGRLIVPGDYSVWADEFRELAARFDVTYGDSFINGIQTADVIISDHPITNGPGGEVREFTGSAINDNLNSTNPDFQVLAQWRAGPASIGYIQQGLGEVVFLSDFSTFDEDLFFGNDNRALWTNLFEYSHAGRLTLNALGTCPGRMGFEVTNASAQRPVAFLYALGEGDIRIPPGNPCAGTTLGLNATVKLARVVNAGADGVAQFVTRVPAIACGRVYMQAIDVDTCSTSNVKLVE